MHLLVTNYILLLSAIVGLGLASAPVVDLGYARYQGLINPTTHNTEFLGIRFAAPPTGNLRWKEPQSPQKETRLQQAIAQPNSCYQAAPGTQNPLRENTTPQARTNAFDDVEALQGRQTAPPPIPQSEDCLFLNVYSPGNLNTAAKKKLPVVVWIHGGGYILGAASGFGGGAFDGNELIRRSGGKVVVVVIQYRLGLFGFLSSQHIRPSATLNAGLLDQEFAFKWVRNHINKFGGDPSKVTIWGESAGAGSVVQHLIANGGNTQPPLFRSAISSSSFLPPQYPFDHRIPEATFAQVLKLSGCLVSQDFVRCLRQVNASVLQEANVQLCNNAFVGTFAFVPVIDGSLIKESPTQAIKKGKVNTKHVLAITNTDEGRIFTDTTIPSTIKVADYLALFLPTLRKQDIRTAVTHYSSFGSNVNQLVEIIGEAIFVCPTFTILNSLDGNVYKGQFAIPPALHADDLVYYFPEVFPGGPAFNNPDFINTFSLSFIDFILEGNPNTKHDQTSILPVWPKWKKSSPIEVVFNRTGDLPDIATVTSSASLRTRCEFWASVAPFSFQ